MAQAYLPQPRSLIVPRRGFRKPARPVLDPNDPINHGLIGCWLLGDAAKGITRDISSYGNNGTISGSPTLGASHHGGLSLVSSGSQYVSCGTNDLFNVTSLSVVAWIKPTGTYTGYNALVSHRNSTTTCFDIYLRQTTGVVGFYNGTAGDESSTAPTTGVWSLLIVTSTTTSGQNNFYLNDASISVTPNTWPLVQHSGVPLYLGTSYPSTDLYFGSMDGVRIYNRVLRSNERQRLYIEPYAGILETAPRWRVGAAAAGFTAVNRRTLGPRVGSRSVY